MSVDPLAVKYLGMSPCNFVGNSPIVAVNPNGEEIRIYYKNNTGETVFVTYTSGMVDNTGNDFVKEAIESLNYLQDNSELAASIIDKAIKTSRVVEVQFTADRLDTGEFTSKPSENSKIDWSPIEGDIFEGGEILHIPAIALFDELDHFVLEVPLLEAIDAALTSGDKAALKAALKAWKQHGSVLGGYYDAEGQRQFENEQQVGNDLGQGTRSGTYKTMDLG